MPVPPNDDAAEAATTSLAESMSNINLSDAEEKELLGEEMDYVEEGDSGPILVNRTGVAEVARGQQSESSTAPIPLNQAVLLDAQMVFHRGRGFLIKELAYRTFDNINVSAVNMIHDADDVPGHLLVAAEDGTGHYDVHTGLKLEEGDYRYEDSHVPKLLSDARVIFVKGANKKKTLLDIYDRINGSSADQQPAIPKPTIVNVDGHTADDEDRRFCKINGVRLASFSFPFVYNNLHVYERMLNDTKDSQSPGDMMYITNVLSKDPKYEFSGKGRIVCICYNDHSRGGIVKSFDKKQRCSLLNISILDHLWLRQQDTQFQELVRNDARRKNTRVVSAVMNRNERPRHIQRRERRSHRQRSDHRCLDDAQYNDMGNQWRRYYRDHDHRHRAADSTTSHWRYEPYRYYYIARVDHHPYTDDAAREYEQYYCDDGYEPAGYAPARKRRIDGYAADGQCESTFDAKRYKDRHTGFVPDMYCRY